MDNKSFCRVCGLHRPEMPWGEDGETSSFEICPCCGAEYGNDDYSIDSIRRYRAKWLRDGCQWFIPRLKPVTWNCEEQLNKIPIEYK